MSDPHFFNKGVTIASFHTPGKWPDFKDELIINVITGKILSIHLTTNDVGRGSNEHDFFEDRIIMYRTSSTDSDLKLVNEL